MERVPDSSTIPAAGSTGNEAKAPNVPRRSCWGSAGTVSRGCASHLKQSDKEIRSKPMWKNTLAARLLNPITNSAESLPREFNNAIKMKCGLQKGAFVFWIVLSYLRAGQATAARGCTSDREEFSSPPLMQLSVIRTSFTGNSF